MAIIGFTIACLLAGLAPSPAASSFPHVRPPFPSAVAGFQGRHAAEAKPFETRFFTQTLDHFTFLPQSNRTFQQRYLINDTHWGGAARGSPIFVYTGNEGDIDWFARNTGFMFEIAPRFQALLLFIEHRYYGESIPFGGHVKTAYKDAKGLGYLTSTQALADFATLIIDFKKNLTATESPVVVFGGSYGGMLAAWFRLKYPHVAVGAVASSAPILAFEGLMPPYSFYDTVSNDYKSESENCYKVLKESWKLIEDTAKQHGGRDLLRNSFRFCKNVTGSVEESLAGWLDTAWVYTAMTDYPTPSTFLNPLPAHPVRQMCRAIDDPATGNDTLAKLHRAASVYYNHTGRVSCFDPDAGSTQPSLGANGWDWQACTEMVMPLGRSEASMFPAAPWDSQDQARSCLDDYGVKPRPQWITTEYGGHDIKSVLRRFGSNIVFFNGLRDPWSGGGVVKNISGSIIAIVAKEGAHHVDLRSSTREDPAWLKDVRRREIRIIRSWLSEYYHSMANQ